ncbi:hypothetical protein INT43_006271 [Umbelopsis isabellina]|uniref:Uncharacterized protein n=1 Tax=Mortierella isabellina TaxID=91625 RepID=A0A8H7PZF1_MORIS|nr:hypothetical protein INT43_006271 [Umbelopsis isabellina]
MRESESAIPRYEPDQTVKTLRSLKLSSYINGDISTARAMILYGLPCLKFSAFGFVDFDQSRDAEQARKCPQWGMIELVSSVEEMFIWLVSVQVEISDRPDATLEADHEIVTVQVIVDDHISKRAPHVTTGTDIHHVGQEVPGVAAEETDQGAPAVTDPSPAALEKNVAGPCPLDARIVKIVVIHHLKTKMLLYDDAHH